MMRLVKRFGIFVAGFIAVAFAQSATALPVGDHELYRSLYGAPFSIGSGTAKVDSEVYRYTSDAYAGKYVYAYQIFNEDSGVGLSYFSVGILDGATAYDPGFDIEVITGVVNPAAWAVVEPPLQSVDALFTKAIHNSFSSAVLWFVSDDPSTEGKAALCGTSPGTPHEYGTGDVLAPVPEPATLFLLGGLSGLMILTQRKRFA